MSGTATIILSFIGGLTLAAILPGLLIFLTVLGDAILRAIIRRMK